MIFYERIGSIMIAYECIFQPQSWGYLRSIFKYSSFFFFFFFFFFLNNQGFFFFFFFFFLGKVRPPCRRCRCKGHRSEVGIVIFIFGLVAGVLFYFILFCLNSCYLFFHYVAENGIVLNEFIMNV